MPLSRYKSADVAPIQTQEVSQGALSATRQAGSNFESLASKLQSFSKRGFQMAGEAAAAEATVQAANDDASGKEFHKESIHSMYGKAYNNARSASYAANAEIDLTTTSGNLAHEFKGDPEGYRKAMSNYYETMQTEAPTPELKGVIGISGRKVTNHAFGQMSIAKDAEVKATQKMEYVQNVDLKIGQAVNAKSKGDLKTYDLIMSSMTEYTKTMSDNNVISEAEVLKIEDTAAYTIEKGVLENTLDDMLATGNMEQAEGLVSKFNEEIPNNLSTSQYENIQSSLNSKYSKQVRLNSVNEVKAQKANKKTVKTGIDLYNAGKQPENAAQLDDLSLTLSEDDQRDYKIAKEAYGVSASFQNLTLSEQETEINKIESKDISNEFEQKVLNQIKSNFNKVKTMAKNDPMSLSIQQGNVPATDALQVGMLPENFIEAIMIRADSANTNKEIYGNNAGFLFTDQEAAQYSQYLESPDTSIADKLAFIEQIESVVPDNASDVYSQLSKKGSPVTSYAGTLVRNGDSQKAEKLLKGVQILKEVPGIVDYETLNWKLAGKVGNAMQFAGAGQRKSLYKASAAYYAASAEENGKLDGALSMSDVNTVISDLTNGLGEKDGQNYFLPKGKTEDDVEDYLDELNNDRVPEFLGMTKEQGIATINKGQLISVGEGLYRVRYNRQFLANADGTPYELKVK